jgi:hypothetical protein
MCGGKAAVLINIEGERSLVTGASRIPARTLTLSGQSF